MAIIKIGNPAIDLDAAEIPNLDTAKITTGQFTDSRIADVAATKITGTITPSDSTVSLAKLTATGTKDATTFLRGDNTFAAAGLNGWSEDGANNNLLPASASAGIYLGVNSATAANLLDDYEEGTFTPAWSSGSATYNEQIGRYTKIGRIVHFNIRLRTSTITSMGSAFIIGLPFTSKNITNFYQSGISSFATSGFSQLGGVGLAFQTLYNSTTLQIYKVTQGDGANYATFGSADLNQVDNSVAINIGGIYESE